MQIIQFMQSGGNPQQMISSMLQSNPQLRDVLQGVNFNDPNSMQQVCRNVCKQKGIDFDTMLAQFRQNGGKI